MDGKVDWESNLVGTILSHGRGRAKVEDARFRFQGGVDARAGPSIERVYRMAGRSVACFFGGIANVFVTSVMVTAHDASGQNKHHVNNIYI